MDNYREMRRLLEEHKSEMERVRRGDYMRRFWQTETLSGVDLACGLCRFVQKSPKSWSKSRDICLSCSMRKNKPPKVFVGNFAIRRWRGTVLQSKFAHDCGVSQPRLVAIEKADAITGKVAAAVAKALAVNSLEGADLRSAIREWPLFPLLAEAFVVALPPPDEAKESFDLGGSA